VLLDGELELVRVVLEICDHLVTGRIAIRIAGEGKTRQAVVTARREQRERFPSLSPGGADGPRFDDEEMPPLLHEEVTHGQSGLACADDGYVKVGVRFAERGSCLWRLRRHAVRVPAERSLKRGGDRDWGDPATLGRDAVLR
jgi:hypothetical protein